MSLLALRTDSSRPVNQEGRTPSLSFLSKLRWGDPSPSDTWVLTPMGRAHGEDPLAKRKPLKPQVGRTPFLRLASLPKGKPQL